MLVRLGYDMQFTLPAATAMVAMLHVHPSQAPKLIEADELVIEPPTPARDFTDTFGNRCSRFMAPKGLLRLSGSTLIEVSADPDATDSSAREHPVEELPSEILQYLLSSRYCEVDLLSNIASDLFGGLTPGWNRVAAICDWINARVAFGYQHARSTRTAIDVFIERVGVCRDFQHLAVTFCRALNIPARYVTGYLGDIGVPPPYPPGDFSAWFEVYLSNRWWTFDARHRQPRIGRVLMAVGRDAADVAITTSFGRADLQHFKVITDEVPAA